MNLNNYSAPVIELGEDIDEFLGMNEEIDALDESFPILMKMVASVAREEGACLA